MRIFVKLLVAACLDISSIGWRAKTVRLIPNAACQLRFTSNDSDNWQAPANYYPVQYQEVFHKIMNDKMIRTDLIDTFLPELKWKTDKMKKISHKSDFFGELENCRTVASDSLTKTAHFTPSYYLLNENGSDSKFIVQFTFESYINPEKYVQEYVVNVREAFDRDFFSIEKIFHLNVCSKYSDYHCRSLICDGLELKTINILNEEKIVLNHSELYWTVFFKNIPHINAELFKYLERYSPVQKALQLSAFENFTAKLQKYITIQRMADEFEELMSDRLSKANAEDKLVFYKAAKQYTDDVQKALELVHLTKTQQEYFEKHFDKQKKK